MYITFESFPWTHQYWVVSVMCLAQWKKNQKSLMGFELRPDCNYLLQVHKCTYFSMYNTWKSMTAITNRLLHYCFVVKSHWFIGRVGLVIVLNYMLIPFACLKKLMPFCIFENLNMCCDCLRTCSLSPSIVVNLFFPRPSYCIVIFTNVFVRVFL